MAKALKPPPRLTVDEWADEFRYLSREASSRPGRWKTSTVEVARGPMRAVNEKGVHTVTVQCSTQLLKTELINNVLGYFVHNDPSPILVVQPTEKLADAWVQDRLDKMIRDTPVLNSLFTEKKSRDSANTKNYKSFPGGQISIVASNSPANLAARPIRIVVADEIDKYPESAGKEGDPLLLVAERTRTFWNALRIQVCSPTVEGRSRIAHEYELSDKRIFEVPCPHCSVPQEMLWPAVKWQNGDAKTAAYHCISCEKPWSEVQRLKQIQLGKWRATAPFNGHAGFKTSKLVSPWEPISAIVQKFLDAKSDPEKLKVFVNTQLGETWKEKGDAPDWERIFDRRESYKIGTVPNGVYFLTAGVDVQENRIECEVVGWGRDKQSWSVQYYVFEGSTASEDAPVWKELEKILNNHWVKEDGGSLSLQTMAIDSGFRTQTVYNFCRRFPINRVIAVKGSDASPVLINSGTFVDVKKGNRFSRRGYKVFTVGVSVLKTELYGWLKLSRPIEKDQPHPAGYCHFPEYDAEFFKQLTAEQLMKKIVRGHPTHVWEKVRERNEALDARCYARAAASYFGIDRFTEAHWEQLVEATPIVSKNAPRPTPENKIKRRESSDEQPETTGEVGGKFKLKRRKSSFL